MTVTILINTQPSDKVYVYRLNLIKLIKELIKLNSVN